MHNAVVSVAVPGVIISNSSINPQPSLSINNGIFDDNNSCGEISEVEYYESEKEEDLQLSIDTVKNN
jgi:hypothetical protein